MDFAAATAALEREFGAQYDIQSRRPDVTIAVVSGGKVESVLDAAPAMCLTKALAIELWLSAARKALDDVPTLKGWALRQPTIDTWNTTIADGRNTHRVAAKRYSASGVIVAILKTQAEIANEEAAAARKRDAALTSMEDDAKLYGTGVAIVSEDGTAEYVPLEQLHGTFKTEND